MSLTWVPCGQIGLGRLGLVKPPGAGRRGLRGGVLEDLALGVAELSQNFLETSGTKAPWRVW